MDVIELVPRLHFIRLPVGHAYLWSDPDGLTLIDAGLPGRGRGATASRSPKAPRPRSAWQPSDYLLKYQFSG
jgi:hypothetical protein